MQSKHSDTKDKRKTGSLHPRHNTELLLFAADIDFAFVPINQSELIWKECTFDSRCLKAHLYAIIAAQKHTVLFESILHQFDIHVLGRREGDHLASAFVFEGEMWHRVVNGKGDLVALSAVSAARLNQYTVEDITYFVYFTYIDDNLACRECFDRWRGNKCNTIGGLW